VKEFLETLARELVERPDDVSVDEIDEGDATVLELDVAPEDRGLVIGRRGRTVEALRVLVDAVARRKGLHYDVRVVE
jgi:predicted RNA-binding protein YlqC (UPF0109 family)